MRPSVLRAAAVLLALSAACRRPAAPPPLVPQTSGTLEIAGLASPVRVVRDRWGVPHLSAASREDLFVAQGLVQAQDRLFQMDLWRRSVQGRLAEVLGANFIERDAMTRRLQYRGDADADWAAHGAGARAVAEAFVRGVNAWVALARDRPPEMFVLAGWLPDFWAAADLLNRTDAFDRRAAVESVERAGLPAPVVDAIRRAGAPPFFTGLAARMAGGPSATPPAGRGPAAADEAVARIDSPSGQYFVHLRAGAWDVMGATAPWRPGVTIGHDGSAAWNRTRAALALEVRVDPMNAAGRTVEDAIAVKGRAEPFPFETRITAGGVVIATDRAAGRQFVLDWGGFAPGTAPGFSGLPNGAARGTPRPVAGVKAAAGADGPPAEGRVVFQHPLAITAAARARFNVGPLDRPAEGAPTFLADWNPRAWDDSRGMNAPGQSEWPDSPHHGDLAALWSAGATFPLSYTDGAVTANGEATLTLVPDRRR